LTEPEKPPRIVCVHAHYSRRSLHDLSGLCSCPTHPRLVECIPTPQPPPQRPRGRPYLYSEKLFMKALVIMIVRRLHRVGELLAVLEEPTSQMRMVRQVLCEEGRFPARRTLKRPLKALPAHALRADRLPLGRHLWWGCLDHGRRREGRSLWRARLLEPKVECGTRRKTKKLAEWRIVP
jgi:hypothetical protein